MTPVTFWLGRVAGGLLIWTLFSSAYQLFGDFESWGRRSLRDYIVKLDRGLRFIRVSVTGKQVLLGQTLLAAAAAGIAVFSRQWAWIVVLPVAAVSPRLLLDKYAARRVARVEEQIEPWLNAVANALKASPSLAEAICSTVTLVREPMSQELDVVAKEYALGTPLDQVLEQLGRRMNSKTLSAAVTALIIARKSGGNLTAMLETTAASLREFARLEAVVRTKTAEGKAQAFVIGIIPVPMVLGVNALEPHFFEPLTQSLVGQLILAVAAALWLTAILAAQKILAVDI